MPRNVRAHALSSGGKMPDLGALYQYSSGRAINDSGGVVGTADVNTGTTGYLVYHAALIPSHPGWVLSSANAVNDACQIVGYGSIHGARRTFLLTPQ